MTPVEASKKENQAQALMNLQLQKKHNKTYDNVNLHDKVRLFRKRKHLSEKEDTPLWSKATYEVVKNRRQPRHGETLLFKQLSREADS